MRQPLANFIITGFIISKCMESYIMINLLMQKPLTAEQLRKINPAKLGYVLKDGTIKFASRDAVLEYAKNMVKKGFYAKEPHEVAVSWKNNRILSVIHGQFSRVKQPKNLPNGCSSMHGHLTEAPISPDDYMYMMFKNNKEEIAELSDYQEKISIIPLLKKNVLKHT